MNERDFNRVLKKIEYDKSGLSAIYAEYYPKIKIHLKRKFGKLVDSEDIAREVFLKLLRYKYSGPVKYPAAWLYKIAENIAVRALEKLEITA